MRLRHTRESESAQLVIQEQLNHIYYPVTGQHKTYDKIKLWHPKIWITSMSNEIGQLASGVGGRMKSGTETIFLSINIKYLQEVRQHMPMQYVITEH